MRARARPPPFASPVCGGVRVWGEAVRAPNFVFPRTLPVMLTCVEPAWPAVGTRVNDGGDGYPIPISGRFGEDLPGPRPATVTAIPGAGAVKSSARWAGKKATGISKTHKNLKQLPNRATVSQRHGYRWPDWELCVNGGIEFELARETCPSPRCFLACKGERAVWWDAVNSACWRPFQRCSASRRRPPAWVPLPGRLAHRADCRRPWPGRAAGRPACPARRVRRYS